MRSLLKQKLEEINVPGNWDFLVTNKGMFSLMGISQKQSEVLTSKHHIYLTKTGRINVAGLNESNINYVAACFKDVIENY